MTTFALSQPVSVAPLAPYADSSPSPSGPLCYFFGTDILAATTMSKRLKARVIALLVTAGFLGGCTLKKSTDLAPDPKMWFIESYNLGIITAKFDGRTYKAKCGEHVSLTPDVSGGSAAVSSTCSMAIDKVGLNIQPLTPDLTLKNLPLFMFKRHGELILRDMDSVENFTIVSVTKTHL